MPEDRGPEEADARAVYWDGKAHSYRPAPDWRDRVDVSLEFFEDPADDLDPVTFEVLRNRLWTINIAHGETITRISGSPVFQALDFNMSILSGEGEIVMNAPYVQYLNAGAPLVIRYILETLSDDPGIDDGDMFLTTDPWVGVSHQMDVCIACPVFIEGKLFAWISNAGHQYDLGGIVPGGWPQNATDVFSDPVVLTPFKLIEKGKLRKDLDMLYRRQSRMPNLVALDLRAQLAGCRFAATRLRETCEQFGASVVKAAMDKILDNAQAAFATKLERIPDSDWTDVSYVDEALPGDRTTHRFQVNIGKRGGRLTLDNRGTEEQGEGPIGFVYANLEGGILGVLAIQMLFEHTFSVGGAARQIGFDPIPGLLNCADHPAPVSGGVLSIMTYMHGMMNTISRMQACDPEQKADIVTSGTEWPLLVVAGVNDRGMQFGTLLPEGAGVGSGSRSFKDGVDTSGPAWVPQIILPNVEATEQFYPVLYLYRREVEDGGGAGRWRGGTGMTYAVTPYRAERIETITNTGGMGASCQGGMGIFGGYPTPTNRFEVLRGTNVEKLFEAGVMPATLDDLSAGDRVRLRAKSNGAAFLPGDVLAVTGTGGSGYGDPLDREPERVAGDVIDGYVSREAARRVYGVELDESGSVDAAATQRRRQRIRDERARWPTARAFFDLGVAAGPPTAATGAPERSVHEYVVDRDEGGERVLACARCGEVLADHAGNYKEGLLVGASSVEEIPLVSDPTEFLDQEVAFRRYCCPGCQVLMTCEVVRTEERLVEEMRLR
jgi:N-methylhydantoinase B